MGSLLLNYWITDHKTQLGFIMYELEIIATGYPVVVATTSAIIFKYISRK